MVQNYWTCDLFNYKKVLVKKYLWLTALLLLTCVSYPQDSGERIVKAIRKGSLSGLRLVLKGADINGYYGESQKSLLQIAIESDQLHIVRYLVRQGADFEQLSEGKTPLIHTAQSGNIRIASYLLKKGADIEGKSEKDNTPLIYASYLGNLEMVKFLVSRGANIDYRNVAGRTPLDYANMFRKTDVASYLQNLDAESEARDLPDYIDGPHIVYKNSDEVVVFYMIRDSMLNEERVSSRELAIRGDSYLVHGFEKDTMKYWIHRKKIPDPAVYNEVDKIFVVGDIHGSYTNVVQLLRNNGVIDDGLNWNWGNGHLVFLGDIFDRGDEVTATLWLIYTLEQQARNKGGRVHYILGNHELMALYNDYRNLSKKYFHLTRFLRIDYSAFFDLDTELGQWIRSRNTVVKINNVLMVHGGLSSLMVRQNLDLEKINRLMFKYLTDSVEDADIPLLQSIMDEQGPLWYRGYFGFGDTYSRITPEALDSVLTYYDAHTVVVGHTNVSNISEMFGGKVIATDIPFYENAYEIQGLLINHGAFYRVYLDGKREEIISGD